MKELLEIDNELFLKEQKASKTKIFLAENIHLQAEMSIEKQNQLIDNNLEEEQSLLDDRKFEILKSMDSIVEVMNFDSLKSIPNMDRVYVDIASWFDIDGIVLAPMATWIVQKEVNVMMFNMQEGYTSRNPSLGVAFNGKAYSLMNKDLWTKIPENKSSKVIVIALPHKEEERDAGPQTLFKVILFWDHS